MRVIQDTNQAILSQLSDLLNAISPESYTTPLLLLHGSSVGQHVRHTIEFYQCLFQQSEQGFVDYDARARNLRVETDPFFAAQIAEELLEETELREENRKLLLRVAFGQDEPQEIETTLARELVYLAEHAIHHFAIIKIALRADFPEITLPEDFGVAFSTLKYRAQV